MKKRIQEFNQWFDKCSYEKQALMSMGMLLMAVMIGAFIFESILAYFIICFILIQLRKI
jgi:hypothetical protein